MTTPVQYAVHPDHFRHFDTESIRTHFLVEHLFLPDQITHTYTHYDRLIIGGAMPVHQPLTLTSIDELKANYFLERRELGIINVGDEGRVRADGEEYILQHKEALYISRGTREVVFMPSPGQPLYYFNSAPAHTAYPTRRITLAEAETVQLGSLEQCNQRIIRKLMINTVLPTCQLQMGLTELQPGSIWNTMPPHTHDRRMEAYFYFNVAPGQAVCHFMGQPQETRHVWVHNHQAVISPPWSIHSGAGTSHYAFIWGMAGENLDYSDMDGVKPDELR